MRAAERQRQIQIKERKMRRLEGGELDVAFKRLNTSDGVKGCMRHLFIEKVATVSPKQHCPPLHSGVVVPVVEPRRRLGDAAVRIGPCQTTLQLHKLPVRSRIVDASLLKDEDVGHRQNSDSLGRIRKVIIPI